MQEATDNASQASGMSHSATSEKEQEFSLIGYQGVEPTMQKLYIWGIALIFGLLEGSINGFGQEVPTPRGELRIVDVSSLNWISIAHHVFDRLIELDADGNLAPGLAAGWRWIDDRTLEVTLRQQVKFHNGESFDAEVVKLNWDAYSRLQQPHIAGEFLN